jgi:hypothetical protein
MTLLLVPAVPAASQNTRPAVLDLSAACPASLIVEDGFADVPQSSVHESAVDCVTWWQVTTGTDWGGYLPADGTSRAANASFVARALAAAGTTMPSNPPDAFTDDDGSVHEQAINQLAALGVVQGTGDRRFSPSDPVNRGQMASMLDRAIKVRTSRPLASGPDAFDDDNGSVHEVAINSVAAAGLAAGTGPRTFEPNKTVRRDQMASFVARMLDLFVRDNLASPPTGPPPPRNTRYVYELQDQFPCSTLATRRLDGTGTIVQPNAECGGASYRPRLSPDGRRIATEMPPYVKVWATDGTGSTLVLADENRLYSVDGWLPDGSAVIISLTTGATDFRGYPTPPFEQRVLPLDGSPSTPYRMTTYDESRSPFGDALTYATRESVSNCRMRTHEFVVPLPSGEPREVFAHDTGCDTDEPTGSTQRGVWLGDGRRLFFDITSTTSTPITTRQGFIVDVVTGETTEVPLVSPAPENPPHFVSAITPDSRNIIWSCASQQTYYSACISDITGANYRVLPGGDDISTGVISFASA